MWIGAALRDVSMTPTGTVASWDRGVVVAVEVAVVVTTGGGCGCGEDCGCEVSWGEGGSEVCDLRVDRRDFCDSGVEGGWCRREWCVG